MWPFSSSNTSVTTTTQQPTASASADTCPVDHETRQAWLQANPGQAHPFQPESLKPNSNKTEPLASSSSAATLHQPNLSTERVISSIPRSYATLGSQSVTAQTNPTLPSPPTPPQQDQGSNWVYPSPHQFYNAMKRKNQNPQPNDMDVVVPIHNVVNEEAWKLILDWERMWTGSKLGQEGTKLISFKGRPRDLTWRAWFRGIAGYQHPFDRHDWIIDRNGHQVRYIIDFYTGRSQPAPASSSSDSKPTQPVNTGLSFFIDVRPAPDTVEGVTMRACKMWNRWIPVGQDGIEKQSTTA